MRKIKFRAWDKKNGVMAEVMNLTFRANEVECVHYANGGGVYMFNGELEIDRYVLMQYTGLKDKNGKMIYEGDIVKDKNFVDSTTGNVLFKDGTFTVDWGFTKDNSEILLCIDNKNCETIGNIYENKDLIK